MAAGNFNAVMDEVFAHEGGYVNNKKDPGGETNFGISKRSYPGTNIRALTRDRAKEIYRSDFWSRIRGDDLNPGIDLVVMDAAVNSGTTRSLKWIQSAARVEADGKIGPVTLRAVNGYLPQTDLIKRACATRMSFLRSLKTWSTFGKGWARRVASVEATAVTMSLQASGANQEAVSRHLIAEAASQARSKISNQAASAASVAGGVTSFNIPDIPPAATALMIAGMAGIAVFGAFRANIASARAKAYDAKFKEISLK